MVAENATVHECEECGRVGLEVEETRVHGRTWTLCPGCSLAVVRRETA